MYIGAWTEYRLGLEKQKQQTKGWGAAQQWQRPTTTQYGNHAVHSAPFGRTGAVGIYHPSLSDKGGEEVAELPDRESFRKTLESALSSNLAVDDVEHITQALEPLLQRLPAIRRSLTVTERKAKAATHCQRNRRENRPRSRRFDVGPRSEGAQSARRVSSSDGTGSARSSFSSASAPINTTSGWRVISKHSHTTYGKNKRTIPSVPQLPRIGHGRDALINITVNGIRPARQSQRSESSSIIAEVQLGNENNSSPRLRHDSTRRCDSLAAKKATVPIATGITEKGCCSPEPLDGGFDGGKAATMLRLARSRDPAGIKADFRQFWSWKTTAHQPKRNEAITASSSGESGGQDTHSQYHDSPMSSAAAAAVGGQQSTAKRAARGGGGEALSKLETLARMKYVYMAKDTVYNGANGQYQSEEVAQGGEEKAGGHPSTCFSLPEEPVVAVPDLELTESRMRLVDKYFGGGGGRRWKFCQDEGYQPEAASMWTPPLWESDVTRRPQASEDCTVGVTVAANRYIHVNAGDSSIGGDRWKESNSTVPGHVFSDGQQMTEADGFVENPSETTVSSQKNDNEIVRLEENSGKKSISSSGSSNEAEELLNIHPSGSGKLGANVPVHLDPENERLPQNESTTLHTEIPKNGDEDVVPAPAWCGDTLEDLVCWTKQLDFDAAVKGF